MKIVSQEVLEAAFDWVDENEFSGDDTTTKEDMKINRLLVVAFVSGAEYAQDHQKEPDL